MAKPFLVTFVSGISRVELFAGLLTLILEVFEVLLTVVVVDEIEESTEGDLEFKAGVSILSFERGA